MPFKIWISFILALFLASALVMAWSTSELGDLDLRGMMKNDTDFGGKDGHNFTNMNGTNGYFTNINVSGGVTMNINWTRLQNYPAAASVGYAITALGDAVTNTFFNIDGDKFIGDFNAMGYSIFNLTNTTSDGVYTDTIGSKSGAGISWTDSQSAGDYNLTEGNVLNFSEIISKKINNEVIVTEYVGSDLGEQLNNAIDDNGDYTNYIIPSGTYTLSTAVNFTKRVYFILNAHGADITVETTGTNAIDMSSVGSFEIQGGRYFGSQTNTPETIFFFGDCDDVDQEVGLISPTYIGGWADTALVFIQGRERLRVEIDAANSNTQGYTLAVSTNNLLNLSSDFCTLDTTSSARELHIFRGSLNSQYDVPMDGIIYLEGGIAGTIIRDVELRHCNESMIIFDVTNQSMSHVLIDGVLGRPATGEDFAGDFIKVIDGGSGNTLSDITLTNNYVTLTGYGAGTQKQSFVDSNVSITHLYSSHNQLIGGIRSVINGDLSTFEIKRSGTWNITGAASSGEFYSTNPSSDFVYGTSTGVLYYDTDDAEIEATIFNDGIMNITEGVINNASLSGSIISNGENLTIYVSFEENEGSIAYDSTINKYDGTHNGNPEYVVGKFGSAIEYDGVGDFTNITENPISSTHNTWLFWYYANEIEINNGFMGNDLASDRGYTMRMHAAGYSMGWSDSGSNSASVVKGTINLKEWTHICVTYDSGEMSIYENNIYLGSGSDVTGQMRINSQSTFLGRAFYDDTAARFYNGKIDEFKFYNRTLSKQEIQAEYLLGLSSHAPTGHLLSQSDILVNTTAIYPQNNLDFLGTYGISNIASFTATAHLDIGAYEFEANTLTFDYTLGNITDSAGNTRIGGNATCTFIYSPDGSTRTEICNS